MPITASAPLNVADPIASASFAKQHLGFTEDMAAEGFVSLSRSDRERFFQVSDPNVASSSSSRNG